MLGLSENAGSNQGSERSFKGAGACYMRVAPVAITTRSVRPDEIPYLHCDEQSLEEYCLGILSEQRNAAVEDHLLVCDECRDALATQSEFIQCLKAALRVQKAPAELACFRQSA